MFYSDNNQHDVDYIIEYVESIIKYNIDKENKNILFKVKVKELQTVFKTENLEKLNKLFFDFKETTNDITIETETLNYDSNDMADISDINFVGKYVPPQEPLTEIKNIPYVGDDIPYVGNDVPNIPNQTNISGGCNCGDGQACNICIDDM